MNGGRGERWPEVERLLDQLLDTEPEARPPLLAQIRADDHEMAAEIGRLLAAIASNEQFLEESAPTFAAPLITRMLERNDLAPGTVLGGYEITSELGRGGMATVYLAQDLKLRRAVALKVLRRQLAATLGSERFLREIAIAARLSHPHILPLHDSGEADGQLYYAMPYVEGESLRQKLKREGQLPLVETIGIVSAVGGALTYAHQQGIVHRDIKPENILLTRNTGDGTLHPLVADFGIARAFDKAGGERLTETGIALGTPAYMSPEQASPGSRLDSRSDIYSLGCVAYEMLAGAPPFTGPTARVIVARHAVDPVPSLSTVRSTVPPPVQVAIGRALAKVPADRFSTADEFAHALTAKSIGRMPRRWTSAFRVRKIAPALVLLTAAGLGVRLLANSTKPAVIPSASKLAVLPLLSLGADTGLVRLGKDLANTISASLNGVGGIETADRLSIASSAGDKDLSPTEGAALARRLGATSIVHGTLVGAGDQVRIDLGLYDTEKLRLLASGVSVTAQRDSVSTLTDSASMGLLRQIWQRGQPPTPSLAAVTTRSLPSLRAFLQGEREIERDQWEAAALAFSSAIAADSTFWLAYFRYALAQYWQEQEVDSQVTATLLRNREAFPERERLMINAWNTEGPAEFERYREITRQFPDYWPGWFMLGDRIYHMGPLHGLGLKESQVAFDRAVALNPRLKPAWEHLLGLGFREDTIESGRALAHIVRFSASDSTRPISERNLQRFRILRLNDALARSEGIMGATSAPLADSVARDWASLEPTPPRRQVAVWAYLWFGFPVAAVDWYRKVLNARPPLRYKANLLRGTAWAWAERGAWDSALVYIARAVRAQPHPRDPGPPTALDEYGLAVLGAWLTTINPAEAIARRGAAVALTRAEDDEDTRRELQGNLAWLDGILAFARGNHQELLAARRRGLQSGHRYAGMIDRSLAAFGHALAGNRVVAGRGLAALESGWLRSDFGDFVTPNIAIDRIAAATWLLEAGDTAQAARLLFWHQSTAISGWEASFSYAVTPLAYLMLARIEHAQGRNGDAIGHYRQFLRRYDSPMANQRHLVDEARTALTGLAGADPAERRRIHGHDPGS